MITQPKRGELQYWIVWVMALAIVSLCGAIVYLHQTHRAELEAKSVELSDCLRKQTDMEREFRAETAAMYERTGRLLQQVNTLQAKQAKRR